MKRCLARTNVERSESRYTKPAERLARKGRVFKGNYQSSPVVILVSLAECFSKIAKSLRHDESSREEKSPWIKTKAKPGPKKKAIKV